MHHCAGTILVCLPIQGGAWPRSGCVTALALQSAAGAAVAPATYSIRAAASGSVAAAACHRLSKQPDCADLLDAYRPLHAELAHPLPLALLSSCRIRRAENKPDHTHNDHHQMHHAHCTLHTDFLMLCRLLHAELTHPSPLTLRSGRRIERSESKLDHTHKIPPTPPCILTLLIRLHVCRPLHAELTHPSPLTLRSGRRIERSESKSDHAHDVDHQMALQAHTHDSHPQLRMNPPRRHAPPCTKPPACEDQSCCWHSLSRLPSQRQGSCMRSMCRGGQPVWLCISILAGAMRSRSQASCARKPRSNLDCKRMQGWLWAAWTALQYNSCTAGACVCWHPASPADHWCARLQHGAVCGAHVGQLR